MSAMDRNAVLAFAHQHVAEPWRKLVAVSARIAAGETLTADEARVRLPLTPFSADARVLYPLLRDFGGLLTWQPNNLFTIILEDDGRTVFRAYLEATSDNNFVEMIELDPHDALLTQAVEMFNQHGAGDLRWRLDEACRERFNRRVNWVKIAKLGFFAAYAEAWRAWETTGDLWAWVSAAMAATQKVYAEGLLTFGQEPPVFSRLRELFGGILQIDPAHLDLKRLFGPLPKPTDHPVVVALSGTDYLVALKVGGADPLVMTVDREVTREFEGLPLKKAARQLRRALRASQVVALRTEPVANLVYEAVRPTLPWTRDDARLLTQRALELVKGFGELWHLSPTPFYLQSWFRFPARVLGLPYDISHIAAWFLPTIIIDAAVVFLGQHNNRAVVLLDEDQPVLAVTIEEHNMGIRRVRTLDPAPFAELFAKLPRSYQGTRERIVEFGLRLWDQGYGFQNMVVGLRVSALRAMGDFLAIKRFANPLRLVTTIRPLMRLIREMKGGGLVVYPDRMLLELEKWIQHVGRVRIYRTLAAINFDRPARTRGLLYVKETIVAAVVVLGIVAAIIWL
jgi:hypothetical protein